MTDHVPEITPPHRNSGEPPDPAGKSETPPRRSVVFADLPGILDAHQRWWQSRGADGERANLEQGFLYQAQLSRAQLAEANLQQAHLREANLIEADLRQVCAPATYPSEKSHQHDRKEQEPEGRGPVLQRQTNVVESQQQDLFHAVLPARIPRSSSQAPPVNSRTPNDPSTSTWTHSAVSPAPSWISAR